MATIHFHQTTSSTPEQFIAGLTDFGPGRSKLFPNSADGYLEVHDRGPTQADVTEGSSGIWERLHYDWSDPSRVVLTTTDSNVWGGNSGHTYTFTRTPDGHDRRRGGSRPRRQEPQRTGARDRGRDRRQAPVGKSARQDRQGDRSPRRGAEAGRAHLGAGTASLSAQARPSRPGLSGSSWPGLAEFCRKVAGWRESLQTLPSRPGSARRRSAVS